MLTLNRQVKEGVKMANVLPMEMKTVVIGALAEGNSIRSIERMTGVHRDTIMRLGVKVGTGCEKILDKTMRNLDCKTLQLDEIWGFIGKKQKHVKRGESAELGDVWTFVAIDAKTKIVPCYRVGNRDSTTANAFLIDLASRLKKPRANFHRFVTRIRRGNGARFWWRRGLRPNCKNLFNRFGLSRW